ncbi:probable methyltransferase PMT16 [Impatiens glandulifera]|uniref:probable methyltransferase PMT16 n=1 Tax=Impatiens glandulifera TaxID=253017 RepID=UPI001FB0FABE|nr:probable methyltransferase PMT16 [Impatiens glandulifera]
MANLINIIHRLISYKSNKSKLYWLIFISILCFTSYLYGLWQTGSISRFSCIPTSQNSSSVADAFLDQNQLDFASHHSAVDLIHLSNQSAVQNVKRFPRCESKYGEYTPCEDADRSLKFDRDRLIYRERHCPVKKELLKCRIPAPYGYMTPFSWPESRDWVWYANVPHKHLTVEKAVQNWIRFEGDRFKFPGGGTMFPKGADSYIDDIGKVINFKDGSIRTAIDTGCGVASWGAYLLSRNITAISFAPRDTHEAQVQFALERGVPALIGVMASIRLPYPARAFDMAHCSRCLIPWGQNEGLYMIEVDRVLRPGGYWILSGPPINFEKHWKGWGRTIEDLKREQDVIEKVARSLCWKKLVQKNRDIAIWQKPTNHIHCKTNRKVFKKPEFCEAGDVNDPDRAWYRKLETCMTPLPKTISSDIKEVSGGQLAKWPERLTEVPPRIIRGSIDGITPEIFRKDIEIWNKRLSRYKALDYQLAEKGRYRNLLDMNANLGGFAASLVDYPVWVMNVVPVEAKVDTLGAIYERGLIGTYHNWCEAMSTYPRTYDFIHAENVFSMYKGRCEFEDILLEMDRILRPRGSVVIRDDVDVMLKVKSIVGGLEWENRMTDNEVSAHSREKILVAVKSYWTSPKDNSSLH